MEKLKILNASDLAEIYNRSYSYMVMILCRPEFNQYLVPRSSSKFCYKDCKNLHKMLKYVITNKRRYILILFALLLNMQFASCQQYKPVIIYTPYGEPKIMIKGNITYDQHGIPKNIHHMEDFKNKQ